MGDLANMTDSDGRVNGQRLLRWLRSKAEVHGEAEATAREMSEPVLVAWNSSRRHLLTEMADDLDAELTPPDYPGDDGGAVDLGEMVDAKTCRDCGRVHNGPAIGRSRCLACAFKMERANDGDTADLDDPALTGGPE